MAWNEEQPEQRGLSDEQAFQIVMHRLLDGKADASEVRALREVIHDRFGTGDGIGPRVVRLETRMEEKQVETDAGVARGAFRDLLGQSFVRLVVVCLFIVLGILAWKESLDDVIRAINPFQRDVQIEGTIQMEPPPDTVAVEPAG